MRILKYNSFLLTAILGLMFGKATTAQNTESINWLSIEDAENLNRNEPRKILIDVYTDWCYWCKVMDKRTFSKPEIAQYINENFYPVKFNAESKETHRFMARDFVYSDKSKPYNPLAIELLKNQMAFPSISYLDENKKIIAIVPGFQKPKDMMIILTYLAENHYKNTEFDNYSKNYSKN